MNMNFKKAEGKKKSGIQMQKLLSRGLAMTLCMCMVLGSVDLTAFADTEEKQDGKQNEAIFEIDQFENLESSIAFQNVDENTDESELNFPDSVRGYRYVPAEKENAGSEKNQAGQDFTDVDGMTAYTEKTEESSDISKEEKNDEGTKENGEVIENEKAADKEETIESEEVTDNAKAIESEEVTDNAKAIESEEITDNERVIEKITGNENTIDNEDEIENSQKTEENENQVENNEKESAEITDPDGADDEQTEKKENDKSTETSYIKEEITIPVTWRLTDAEKFDSSIERKQDTYTYEAVLTDEYRVAQDVSLPQIVVTVVKDEFKDKVIVGDLAFDFEADEGVLPEGAKLVVTPVEFISKEELCSKIETILWNMSVQSGTIYNLKSDTLRMFDISMTDEEGNTVQPDLSKGKVKVHVYGIGLETVDMAAFYVSDTQQEAELTDCEADVEKDILTIYPEHFSNYAFAQIDSSNGISYAENTLNYVPMNTITNEKDTDYLFYFGNPVTNPSEYKVGDRVVFVPRTNTSITPGVICAGVPAGSAVLQATEISNSELHGGVMQAAEGFDACRSGKLHSNLTKYNCDGGAVVDLQGTTYTMQKVYYFSTAQVTLNRDGSPWSGQQVELRSAGRSFGMNDAGNGVYTSSYVLIGTYSVYVNGKNSGYTLNVSADQFNSLSGVQGNVTRTPYNVPGMGRVYGIDSSKVYNTSVYEATVNYRTLRGNIRKNDVTTTEFGTPKLYNASGYVEYTGVYNENNGDPDNYAYAEFYLSDKDTAEYELYTDGRGGTGLKLSTGMNVPRTVTADYYDMVLEMSTDEKWTDANVTIRDEEGYILSTLKYNLELTNENKDGNTVYTNLMYVQKAADGKLKKLHVYVDGQDVHKEVETSNAKRKATVTFYTAQVTVKENDKPWTTADVVLNNGVEYYTLSQGAVEDGVYKANVLKNEMTDEADSELPYELNITGTIDDGEKLIITSDNKEKSLDYYSITYMNYERNEDDTYKKMSSAYRTQHILKGCTASVVDDPMADGLTFDGWSTDTWLKDGEKADTAEEDYTVFDYSEKIDKGYVLYAHYNNPGIVINGFIKTNENGAVDGEGDFYRLANMSISGFASDDTAIRSVLIETTNVKNIRFLPVNGKIGEKNRAGVILTQSNGEPLTTDKETGVNESASATVTVNFYHRVSMEEAQYYVRENIVFDPEKGQDSAVKITASDGVVSASGQTTIKARSCSETWTSLNGNVYNKTLGSYGTTTYYYLTGNYYCNYSGSGSSGLTIRGNVYIYLNGYGLYAYGGSGSYRSPGGAAIQLNSGNQLYLLGPGTVYARGGNAGSGSSGSKPGSDSTGGSGGSGGGGAGAGIGTNGGYGGSGGSGYSTWGSSGESGSSGASMGTLYVYGAVNISAYGGSSGSGASGGGNQGNGAGGGGGGGGAAAYGIGTGGGGAGGGGGGAGKKDVDCGKDGGGTGGSGGSGGRGYSTGGSGSRGNNGSAGSDSSRPGGSGGSGGNGYGGSARSYNGGAGVTTYTVNFSNALSNAVTTYNFINNSSKKNIMVPNYKAEKGWYFLGWQLSVAGKVKSGTSSYELTNTQNSKLYQPGSSITVMPGTYGTIEFKPALKEIGGVYATSEEQLIPANKLGKKETYYKYWIRTTLDGVATNMEDVCVSGEEEGKKVTYSLSSDNSTGEYYILLPEQTTFDIYVGGEKTGKEVTGVALNTETGEEETANEPVEIAYESIKVFVKGQIPESFKLVNVQDQEEGKVPTLRRVSDVDENGYYTYQYNRLVESDKGQYYVVINGEKVPYNGSGAQKEGLAVVQFGNPVTVSYSTVTVNVGGNGEVEKVVLRDTNGKIIPLARQEAGKNIYSVTKFTDSAKTYMLVINGKIVKTSNEGNSEIEVTTDFSQDHTLSANVFDVIVNTYLDNQPAEMGMVKVNDREAEFTGTGTYEFNSVSANNFSIAVAGKKMTELTLDSASATSDATVDLHYYTVNYDGNATYDYSEIQGEDESATEETHSGKVAAPAASVCMPNEKLSLAGFGSEDIPTRIGYSFMGWSTDANATIPEYTFGQHDMAVSKTTTLYAVWKEDYEVGGLVSFDYRDNTASVDGIGIVADDKGKNEDGTSNDIQLRKTYVVLAITAKNANGEDVTEKLLTENLLKKRSVAVVSEGVVYHYQKDGEEKSCLEKEFAKIRDEEGISDITVEMPSKQMYSFGTLPSAYQGSAITYELSLVDDENSQLYKNAVAEYNTSVDKYNVMIQSYKKDNADDPAVLVEKEKLRSETGTLEKYYLVTESQQDGQMGRNYALTYQPDGQAEIQLDISTDFKNPIDRVPGAIRVQAKGKNNQYETILYYESASKSYSGSVSVPTVKVETSDSETTEPDEGETPEETETAKYTYKLNDDYTMQIISYQLGGVWYTPEADQVTHFTFSQESGQHVDDNTAVDNRRLAGKITEISSQVEYRSGVGQDELGNVSGIDETTEDPIYKGIDYKVRAQKPSRIGYTFEGWKKNDASGLLQPGEKISTDSVNDIAPVTLTAQWKVKSFKISYGGMAGAAYGSSHPTEYDYAYNGQITISAPTKTGYVFTGWKVNGKAVTDGKDLILPADKLQDYDLNALWRETNTVGIIYQNMDGASFVTDDHPISHAESSNTVIPAAEKRGYTFLGWSILDADDGFTLLKNSTITSDMSFNGDIVLKAEWQVNTYQITYSNKPYWSGSGDDNSTSEEWIKSMTGKTSFQFDTDQIITLPDTEKVEENDDDGDDEEERPVTYDYPVMEHYTFDGWTVNGSTDGTVRDLTIKAGDYAENISLEANWKPDSWKITYEGMEGAVFGELAPEEHLYGNPDTTRISDPTRYGYVFKGWTISDESADNQSEESTEAKTENAQNAQVGTTVSLEENGLTGEFTGVITLKANWEAKKYHINLNLSGGTLTKDGQAYTDSYTMIKSHDTVLNLIGFDNETRPVKDGYSFVGWSFNQQTENAGSTAVDESYYMPSADYTIADHLFKDEADTELYAVWEKDVKLSGKVKFTYNYKDIHTGAAGSAEGEEISTTLKISAARYNALTGELDKTFQIVGGNTQNVKATLASDGKTATTDYDLGTYPRTINGVPYRYVITAEEVENYITTRECTAEPGQVNFNLQYAPDRFLAAISLELKQGRADLDCIPYAIKVRTLYKTKSMDHWEEMPNGYEDDRDHSYDMEITYSEMLNAYETNGQLWKTTQAGEEALFNYEIVAYKMSENADWTDAEDIDFVNVVKGVTGISKKNNRTMTGTLNLLDKKKPEITLTYTPTGKTEQSIQAKDTESSKGENNINPEESVAQEVVQSDPLDVSITATDTNLKRISYYIADYQMNEADLEKLQNSDWVTVASGDLVQMTEGKRILYVKAEDVDGNVRYASTPVVKIDNTPPVIVGVKDGGVYCTDKRLQITDITSVKVKITSDTDTMTDISSQYKDPDSDEYILTAGKYVITVTDELGQINTLTVEIRNGHTFGKWMIDSKATKKQNGIAHHTCEVCGVVEYQYYDYDDSDHGAIENPDEDEIDIISGNINKIVICDPDAPKMILNTSCKDMIEAISGIDSLPSNQKVKDAYDEYLSQIADPDASTADNIKIDILTEIQMLDEDTVPSEDNRKIRELLKKTIGQAPLASQIQFMDISMYAKIVKEAVTSTYRITNTEGEIAFTIDIPDSMINKNASIIRDYQIIRCHEGKTEFLLNDWTTQTTGINFETDKFSTYAIVYRDTKKPEEKPEDDGSKDNSSKDNDSENSGSGNGGNSSINNGIGNIINSNVILSADDKENTIDSGKIFSGRKGTENKKRKYSQNNNLNGDSSEADSDGSLVGQDDTETLEDSDTAGNHTDESNLENDGHGDVNESSDTQNILEEIRNCFWHWFILVVIILSVILIFIRRKTVWYWNIGVLAVDVILTLIFTLLGNCVLDRWFFAGGIILIIFEIIGKSYLFKEDDADIE